MFCRRHPTLEKQTIFGFVAEFCQRRIPISLCVVATHVSYFFEVRECAISALFPQPEPTMPLLECANTFYFLYFIGTRRRSETWILASHGTPISLVCRLPCYVWRAS